MNSDILLQFFSSSTSISQLAWISLQWTCEIFPFFTLFSPHISRRLLGGSCTNAAHCVELSRALQSTLRLACARVGIACDEHRQYEAEEHWGILSKTLVPSPHWLCDVTRFFHLLWPPFSYLWNVSDKRFLMNSTGSEFTQSINYWKSVCRRNAGTSAWWDECSLAVQDPAQGSNIKPDSNAIIELNSMMILRCATMWTVTWTFDEDLTAFGGSMKRQRMQKYQQHEGRYWEMESRSPRQESAVLRRSWWSGDQDDQDEEVVRIHHLCSSMLSTSVSIKYSFLIYSFVIQKELCVGHGLSQDLRSCLWVVIDSQWSHHWPIASLPRPPFHAL